MPLKALPEYIENTDDDKLYCNYCKSTLSSRQSMFRHCKTKKHISNSTGDHSKYKTPLKNREMNRKHSLTYRNKLKTLGIYNDYIQRKIEKQQNPTIIQKPWNIKEITNNNEYAELIFID